MTFRQLTLAAALLAAPLAAAEPAPLVPCNEPQPRGALTGASVFVNPGHGWFISGGGRWSTQRGVSHGLIEDHSNAEAVMQFLVPYLWNAGARVYTARERDMNPNMAIVDASNDAAGTELTGRWDTWRGSGTWKGDCIWTSTVDDETTPTATARFVPDIPEEGYYSVYIWYRNLPPRASAEGKPLTAAPDAQFQIAHTGGTTVWTQDLSRDAGTWTYFGRYWFEKGRNPATGSVSMDNRSAVPGTGIAIDAVRFGGGMGDTLQNGTTSGKPRWEESGQFYVPFLGYSAEGDTRSFNSVGAMPMWAEWECEDWELGRSVYLSWHTNASSGKSRGLSSFIYGPNAWGPVSEFLGHPGGDVLTTVIHGEVINGVRQTVQPEWRDIGTITRWLGETNPRNNNRMPAALVEYGFHDNAEDAALILDPRFRRVASRATMQGVVKYYAEHLDGFDNATILPEPPTHFQVVMHQDTAVELTWQPPTGLPAGIGGDSATEYRVYTSINGKGFDNGQLTSGTLVHLPMPPPGETRYYRVAARNAGGESFPSETLAFRSPFREALYRALIVNGFDRLDGAMNLLEGEKLQRGIIERMNTRDYAIQHAKALAKAGYVFDSASNEAVTAQMLRDRRVVVWILGQEKGETEALSSQERALLTDFLAGGGALFLTGSEWATELSTTAEGQAFLRDQLGVEWVEDSAGAKAIALAGGQTPTHAFEVSNSGWVYPVTSVDVIRPVGAATAFATYAGTDKVAAVVKKDGGKVFVMGTPFECLLGDDARAGLMAEVLKSLLNP